MSTDIKLLRIQWCHVSSTDFALQCHHRGDSETNLSRVRTNGSVPWNQSLSRFQQRPTACRYIFSCQSGGGRARPAEVGRAEWKWQGRASPREPVVASLTTLCSRRDLAFTGSLYVTANKAKGQSLQIHWKFDSWLLAEKRKGRKASPQTFFFY